MKAGLWDKIGHVSVVDVPDLTPGYGQVKIKIAYASICYNDVPIVNGKYAPLLVPPMILGHEYCGTVVEVGEGVPDYVKVGQRMIGDIQTFCGQCFYCHSGIPHMCEHKKTPPTGSFAEYCLTPWEDIEFIPDDLPFETAVLGEVVSACIHGIDEAHNHKCQSGQSVAIFGGNLMAQLRLQLAIRAGAAKVVIIESQENQKEMALKLGADVVIDPIKEDLISRSLELTNGRGFDIVIEDSNKPENCRLCLDIARPAGTVLWGGNYMPEDEVTVPLQYLRSYKMLHIATTIQSPYTFPRAVAMLGKLQVAPLISKIYPLEQLQDALDYAASGHGFATLVKP